MDGIYLDTSEIRDEEIDVEEIMRKIKESIKARKEQGDWQDGKLNEIRSQNDGAPNDIVLSNARDIQEELDQIGSHWDIRNRSYAISSHRPIVGSALVKGRQIVNGEISRYIDPMVYKQVEFNASVVNILNETTRKIDKFRDELDGILNSHLDQVKAIVDAMNEEIENRAWLAGLLEKRINNARSNLTAPNTARMDDSEINYFVFEERYRGSRADIKKRQSEFLQFFAGCQSVLDIGCGRGEFLELLKEHEIGARGIDIDEDMINFCQSKGFNVNKIDAVSYLNKIDDKSVDGVFIDQVVEHLTPEYFINMLDLCYKKLIFGGSIVVETVNPLSFLSFANFYIDISHIRPMHPETLRFLLQATGFREIETRFFSPVQEDAKLKKIDFGAETKLRRSTEIYNHNVDLINNILFGAQDYAVIGKR